MYPRSWLRVIFGAELGVEAVVTLNVGFAFTGTAVDLLGGSIIFDADIGLGPGAGAALLCHLNGLVALEITLGPVIGVGVGVGYGLSISYNPIRTTPMPTPLPTPTVNPTLKPI